MYVFESRNKLLFYYLFVRLNVIKLTDTIHSAVFSVSISKREGI